MKRALLALAVLVGCASPGPDSIEGELSVFDPAEFEGKVFYIDRSISNAPLTAEDLGADVDRAIPVGIRVHAHFAVAWHAPNGEPRVGDRDSVVAAWRIYTPDELEDIEAHPTSGDVVAPPNEEEVVVTPPGYDTPDLTEDVTFQVDLPSSELFQTPPQLRVYWFENFREAWVLWWTYHPECA